MGVPIVSDLRVLIYNATTFAAAIAADSNLRAPPPAGDWGSPYSDEWNWKAFADTAMNITALTGTCCEALPSQLHVHNISQVLLRTQSAYHL
jgi:hypothetical protein